MVDVEKLMPYFRALTVKSRLIVYLLATGSFSYNEVRKVTANDLAIAMGDIPAELDLFDICDELMHGLSDDDIVFFSSSRPMYSINHMIDILKRSHKNAEVDYIGLSSFVEKVTSN